MQSYELAVVLPGKASAAKKKSETEKITKLVKTYKGKVGKVDDWGERKLEYKIKGNDSGTFLIFPIELDRKEAKNIDAKLRLDEDVIRYLLVRK